MRTFGALALVAALAAAGDAPEWRQAREILDAVGIRGGLIVHLGCGNGTLTAALAGQGRPAYTVHGLDPDPANVEKARAHVRSLNLYGKVTAEVWASDRLPYVDNLVNLIVATAECGVRSEEILRVLAPNGVALVGGKRTVKPRPKETDDWTHYLYDASNNAVSRDVAVGPPRHFQWLAGPRYSRHHDHMSGASAMAAASGRIFYIFDHASPQAIQLPSVWRLTARDAFNGTVLWERPIEHWHTQMFRLKSGPAQLTRRLVAIGDRVYVTLGLEAPVSVLDAATGHTLHTCEGTAGAEELIVHDGVLFAVANDKPFRQPPEPKDYSYAWPEGPRRLVACDPKTGKTLWSTPQPCVLLFSLCADARRVVFHDGQGVVALDRRTGEPLWRSAPLAWRRPLPTSFAPTLVLCQDVALFSGGGKAADARGFATPGNVIHALSLADGKELWNATHPPSGHRTAQDALAVGGLVWLPAIAQGTDSGEMIGRDLKTGEVKKRFLPDVKTHWFHHRCYRSKATDKYLLTSRTGIEFVDPTTGHWECHHWVRGACLYGILPANGMVYNAPHPCACYLEAKLYGFHALAPQRGEGRGAGDEGRGTGGEGGERLERGPAFSEIRNPKSEVRNGEDWPTYRHDPARSGATKAAVPHELKQAWEAKLGGRLSALTVADGKLLVASIDDHSVHALDAASGKPLWAFTAGGRVDSPPTLWHGQVLFGSADGCVYCLRASDGALAWRFRAAPLDRRMCAFEQLESLWPVHGSVLVVGGTSPSREPRREDTPPTAELWCVAGRSMFLDGGLRLVRLNPATGALVAEHVLDDRDPASGRNLQAVMQGLNMAVALPDVLSCDAKYVYMRSQRFTPQGVRQELEAPNLPVSAQRGEGPHLFSPTGFLDDDWWHRSYWVFGRVWKSGAGGYYQAGHAAPAGRPLVFDDARVYGYARKPQYYRWTTPMEYQLFASAKQPELVRQGGEPKAKAKAAKKGVAAAPQTRIATDFTTDVPVLVRAMVLADATLFIAGPPDVVDEAASLGAFGQEAAQKLLARQAAALGGAEGGVLWAVAAADGKKLAELKLGAVPVFDGLAAANGRLFMSTLGGSVICLGKGDAK
ncbi:MAG: methyltransferase domain-containing protein [Planctomycetes bacterium]|nr:methyltransferase domain-containing protein [Planctomycetota bacterium]